MPWLLVPNCQFPFLLLNSISCSSLPLPLPLPSPILTLPLTSNFLSGDVVPIPTSPNDVMSFTNKSLICKSWYVSIVSSLSDVPSSLGNDTKENSDEFASHINPLLAIFVEVPLPIVKIMPKLCVAEVFPSPITINLSLTVKFWVSIVVVVPFTVRFPSIVVVVSAPFTVRFPLIVTSSSAVNLSRTTSLKPAFLLTSRRSASIILPIVVLSKLRAFILPLT